MGVLAEAPSKYVLTELTLRSMIELERAQAGMDFESDVLGDLSSAMLNSSDQGGGAAPFQFIEPGLYEPYERLVRHVDMATPPITRIRDYIKDISISLSRVAAGDREPAPALIGVCTSLHQELVQEINEEDALAINDWPSAGEGAAAGLGAA